MVDNTTNSNTTNNRIVRIKPSGQSEFELCYKLNKNAWMAMCVCNYADN
jgi:hypothetical protein